MAEKKKNQTQSYQKRQNADAARQTDKTFDSGGSGYKPRDETRKSDFGFQSDQQRNTFTGSDNKRKQKNPESYRSEQPQENETKQSQFHDTTSQDFRQKSTDDTSGYHKRDTYHQSSKKGSYHRKRVQKEQNQKARSKVDYSEFQTKDTTFTETTGDEFVGSEKLNRKKQKAEKAASKTMKARQKLPTTREYTMQRVFDEKTGRAHYELRSLERPNPFKPEGLTKTAVKRMQMEQFNQIHNKIAQVEKENSAVEGAHKTEQTVESAYRFVKQNKKSKEAKMQSKVAKLEKKQFKKETNFLYQKFLEENPQMQEKTLHRQLQKRLQKQRIKKAYAKAKRTAASSKVAQEAMHNTATVAAKVARKIQELIRAHASLFASIGIFALLLVMIMTSISSCGAMFAGTQSTILASAYMSEPAEIDATDLEYTRLEMELQNTIDNIETDHPDYDEYDYNVGDIGHNPFTLISYLSAIHTQFTASGVQSEVESLFNEMYTLTLTPTTEIRTGTDDDGEEYEYEVSILRVTLTVNPLESIVAGKMNAEQKDIYDTYNSTGGLLQNFASPVELYWYNYISSYYGYRKNPVTGAEQFHRGVDIAVPTGTNVNAGHDGTVTEAAYDSSYGNYVVITKDGYTTKYAHMDTLNVSVGQTVKKGDLIGKSGNTGSSTGSHLHIECLHDGEYYNPLFYFDVGTGTLYGEPIGGGGGVAPGGDVIPPESYDDETVRRLMAEAIRYIGMPYTFGGIPPSSFDCSGFVCWAFTNSGVRDLPRTTAQGIYNQCAPVSASDAKAGDLVFFQGTYNTGDGRVVTHVGIYCGNGVMLHCGDPIKYSSINTSYWQSHFYGFGRLT